jgi:hypothetical protein
MGKRRSAYLILVGRPEGKRPLRRPGHRWDDNIRMDLREIRVRRWGLYLSGSGKRLVAGSCEHSNEPSGSIRGGFLN